MFEAGQGRLKVVGRAGVGIDNVDLQAATEVSLLPCRDFSMHAAFDRLRACACVCISNGMSITCLHSCNQMAGTGYLPFVVVSGRLEVV